jgi:hypothetical protein
MRLIKKSTPSSFLLNLKNIFFFFCGVKEIVKEIYIDKKMEKNEIEFQFIDTRFDRVSLYQIHISIYTYITSHR